MEQKEKRQHHGLSNTREWCAWKQMMQRCYRPKGSEWKNYGGRGIYVCTEWHTFTNFFKDMGLKPLGGTLERTNNEGNYEPSNCRWANRIEQANNKRTSHKITFKGETRTVAQWARHLGYSKNLIETRLHRGWNLERAFTMPPKHKKHIHKEALLKCERIKEFVVQVKVPVTIEATTYEEAARRATSYAQLRRFNKFATILAISEK